MKVDVNRIRVLSQLYSMPARREVSTSSVDRPVPSGFADLHANNRVPAQLEDMLHVLILQHST